MVKVKSGRIKQVVTAVYNLRGREGVSVDNVDMFLQQRFGTCWSTEECAQALKAAVVEGFVMYKGDRLYPCPCPLGQSGQSPGGAVTHPTQVHRPRKRRVSVRRQQSKSNKKKIGRPRGRPSTSIMKLRRRQLKAVGQRENLTPVKTLSPPSLQAGDNRIQVLN